uniref:Inosine triphosphate pyrophosphatase n=1 Tax=Panagrolaimus sp. JU765 TaxID=591449 RepID=A0AC34RPK4_9BILA
MTQYPLEIPEIQGTIQEIIQSKIESARTLSKHFPILVDDTALEIEALNNWPGPYVKEFLDSFKAEGIVDLVKKIDPTNTKAKAICSLGYLESPTAEPIFGFGIVEGILKLRSDGKYSGFGFDPVFYPDVDDKAFSDLSMEEKGNMSHRAGALLDLCAKLEEKSS